MASKIRTRLAKVIEREMLEQHGLVVVVDPEASFSIAMGFYRTSMSDTYRWTCHCRYAGSQVGPIIDSYDTMTESVKGVILQQNSRHPNEYDATARSMN